MKIGVTGATGFVGSALCRRLDAAGIETYSLVRNARGLDREIVVGDLGAVEDDQLTLPHLDAIIHLAARAHVMKEESADPLEEYRKVNVIGTRRIAEAAARAGITHFIFLSSIKVNGESTTRDRPFDESDVPKPEDPYAQSKLEAEAEVRRVYEPKDTNWTIVRPPLVYGPGVKGNFRLLMKLACSWIPLPFGNIDNDRSMIFVGNLADFLVCTLTHAKANNEVFLISDGVDLSTSEMVRKIAKTAGKRPLILSMPPFFLKICARIAGRSAMVDRLVGSLQVDTSKAKDMLSWSPPYNIEEAFRQTVFNDSN